MIILIILATQVEGERLSYIQPAWTKQVIISNCIVDFGKDDIKI